MEGVVIYGAGSPIVVDVEESLERAGLSVCAAIPNMDCESWVLDRSKPLALDSVTDQIKARPFLDPLFTPGNRQAAAREAAGRGFGRPFTLIDPTVPQSRSFQAAPGTYVNAGCTLGAAGRCEDLRVREPGAQFGAPCAAGSVCLHRPGRSRIELGDRRFGGLHRLKHRRKPPVRKE